MNLDIVLKSGESTTIEFKERLLQRKNKGRGAHYVLKYD